jgi:integrase
VRLRGTPASRSANAAGEGNRQFAVRCRRAGVRYIRVHDTRRTCASLLVALDVHPRVAMQILRHSQIAMTMKVYSQVPTAKTRSALERLDKQPDGYGCSTFVLYGAQKGRFRVRKPALDLGGAEGI